MRVDRLDVEGFFNLHFPNPFGEPIDIVLKTEELVALNERIQQSLFESL